jgi:hypothetical protein
MKIEQAQLDELKKKYGQIYEGEIRFEDAENKTHSVEFVFREPKVTDVEAYFKSTQTVGAIDANLNLIQSLAVHPEPVAVVNAIREYPNAYGKFIEAVIQPFFGANAVARKKKL